MPLPAQSEDGSAIYRGSHAGPRVLARAVGKSNVRLAAVQVRQLFSARHDTALVLITHDTGLSSRCSRQISLADGRIVNGATSALTS